MPDTVQFQIPPQNPPQCRICGKAPSNGANSHGDLACNGCHTLFP